MVLEEVRRLVALGVKAAIALDSDEGYRDKGMTITTTFGSMRRREYISAQVVASYPGSMGALMIAMLRESRSKMADAVIAALVKEVREEISNE